jgi:hypothetical protein
MLFKPEFRSSGIVLVLVILDALHVCIAEKAIFPATILWRSGDGKTFMILEGDHEHKDEDEFPILAFSLSEVVGHKNNQLFGTEKEWKQPDCMMLSSYIICQDARMNDWMKGTAPPIIPVFPSSIPGGVTCRGLDRALPGPVLSFGARNLMVPTLKNSYAPGYLKIAEGTEKPSDYDGSPDRRDVNLYDRLRVKAHCQKSGLVSLRVVWPRSRSAGDYQERIH